MANREYLYPSEVDRRLSLPNGRAARMARRGQLPAVILPDGTIRIPTQEFEKWLASCRASERAAAPAAVQAQG